jgi:hypothetical protein
MVHRKALMFIDDLWGYLSMIQTMSIERSIMKASRLRILAVPAVVAALATGLTATAASAATAHAATAQAGSAAVASAPAASPGSITSTVTGTFTNADGQGTFAGTFTPKKFAVVNGVLQATGLLKGTMTDANGTKLGTVSQTATLPVKTSAASSGAKSNAANAALACNVLDLVLGPLNLNLLGLVVTLNQVHLVINAVPGAGNLLGNLLCAVAGLLNGGGVLSGVLGQIATLLNQILALL